MTYYKVIDSATGVVTVEQAIDAMWESLSVEVVVEGGSSGGSAVACLGSSNGGETYPYNFGHALDIGTASGDGDVAALVTGVLINAVKIDLAEVGTSASVTVYVAGK